ncbi:ent-kaurenoic acid oxidase-like isoform X2 [Silene latifolia]|uniref:ent-kaurenoic acid oxidase-like isoform X2 n=1 Tax=Silene latifolia TaxID=37657 RepID=UPI003D773FEA
MEINMVYVIHSLLWPLIACLFWWWNEIWYATPVRARCKSLNAKLPPGHLGIPIFGEYFTFLWYFHFLRRPDRYITSKMDKYGRNNVGAYTTFLYGSPAIIACSPSLCKKILTATTGFKQGWPSSEVLGPHSVITIHGSRHQHIKGLLASEFNHRDALTRVALQFQPCIVAALESWFQMGRINTFYQIKRVALEFMGRYMGGLELGPEINDLENLFSTVNEGVRAQPWNFPGTPFRHALQCRKKLTEKLTVELMKKKREGKKMGATSDMMDRLMQSKDKEGRHLSNEEVVDNVLSNIAISYIGIAYPVTWCMYFLAKNPHVLQKLRVVEETIRMASISGFIFKKATEDIKFEGYLIPKGWNVLVWLRFLHIDPSNFEDPLTFNPDRWDSLPKYGTYLPFGGGARTCPGSTMARLITVIFLHHLAIGYRWELANPDMLIIYLSHPVPADGVEVSFSKI